MFVNTKDECYNLSIGGFMNKQQRLKIYNKAEQLWGKVAQYDQAIEEMAELIVAINKYKRKCLYGEYKQNAQIEENLVEELADVKMCLEQLWNYMGEKRVEEMLDKKMEKFQQQINEMTKQKGKK